MTSEGDHKTAMASIDLLEDRLRRVAFYTTGADDIRDFIEPPSTSGRHKTIQTRLQRLDDGLQRLASKSSVVKEILSLYGRENRHMIPQVSGVNGQAVFSDLERLAIIQSCAPLFPTSASRLTSIQDLPVPSAESSANLIALHPRLARVELLQKSQSQEVAGLRLRTASILQRWYEIGVLAQGECWTEWQERMMEVEKALRREEASRAREAAAL